MKSMTYSMEITPDRDGYVTRTQALLLVAQKGYCPGPVSEAMKNRQFHQLRSSNKKKAQIRVKMEDVWLWIKKNCNPK